MFISFFLITTNLKRLWRVISKTIAVSLHTFEFVTWFSKHEYNVVSKMEAFQYCQKCLDCLMNIHLKSFLSEPFKGDNMMRSIIGEKTTIISKQNRLKRRIFCISHLHRNVALDWARAIFSDETQVVIVKNRRVQAWRKNEEKWKPPLSWDLQWWKYSPA